MAYDVVLLGAGASIDAGLPSATQLTDAILRSVETHEYRAPSESADSVGPAARVLNSVIRVVQQYNSHRGVRPSEPVDVERLFSAVQSLARRDELDIAAFVSEWESTHDLTSAELESWHGEPYLYEIVSSEMLDALSHVLNIEDRSQVEYLEKMLVTHRRIATLNYDLSVEYAADSLGLSLTTGLRQWRGGFSWNWDSHNVQLLKMHGSLNWRSDAGPAGFPTFLSKLIEMPLSAPLNSVEYASITIGPWSPGLIFGAAGKLRPDGPFLAMLVELSRWLTEAKSLLVIGYSFRDEHINALILEWLNSGPKRALDVVDPGFPNASDPDDPGAGMTVRMLSQYIYGGPGPCANIYPYEWEQLKPKIRIIRETALSAMEAGLSWTQPVPERTGWDL